MSLERTVVDRTINLLAMCEVDAGTGTVLEEGRIMLSNAVVMQRSAELHEACPVRARVKPRPSERPSARAFGDPAGLSYYAARQRLAPPRHPELLALAKYASSRVPKQVLRELMASVSLPTSTAEHLNDARRVIDSTFFRCVGVTSQVEIMRAYGRLDCSDQFRRAVLDLYDLPLFERLESRSRQLIFRYALGPRTNTNSHREHVTRVQDFWATRVASLTTEFAGFDVADDGEVSPDERVTDSMLRVDHPFHILRTAADLDLYVLVFGAYNDPNSFSYARSYANRPDGHAEATIVCPDPRVARGWRDGAPLVDQTFELRSTELNRTEELEFLRWIENNHAVGPDETHRPADIPLAIFGHARRLGEAIEPVVNMIASGRSPLHFDRSLVCRGQPAAEHRRRLCEALARAAAPGA